MASLASTHAELLKAYSSGSADIKSQLTRAKIELTQTGLLVPSPNDAANNTKEVVLARDILEVGAFWSLKQKDVDSFDRYVGLLRVFYHDCGYVECAKCLSCWNRCTHSTRGHLLQSQLASVQE